MVAARLSSPGPGRGSTGASGADCVASAAADGARACPSAEHRSRSPPRCGRGSTSSAARARTSRSMSTPAPRWSSTARRCTAARRCRATSCGTSRGCARSAAARTARPPRTGAGRRSPSSAARVRRGRATTTGGPASRCSAPRGTCVSRRRPASRVGGACAAAARQRPARRRGGVLGAGRRPRGHARRRRGLRRRAHPGAADLPRGHDGAPGPAEARSRPRDLRRVPGRLRPGVPARPLTVGWTTLAGICSPTGAAHCWPHEPPTP